VYPPVWGAFEQSAYPAGINPTAIVGVARELVPASWGTIGAWILLILTPLAWLRETRHRRKSAEPVVPHAAAEHSHH